MLQWQFCWWVAGGSPALESYMETWLQKYASNYFSEQIRNQLQKFVETMIRAV